MMDEHRLGDVFETNDASNGRAYLGNGYVGLELSPLGGLVPGTEGSSSRIRGLYSDTGPGRVDRLITLIGWADVRCERAARVTAYRRRLDIARGIVQTKVTAREERGSIDVEQVAFLSRADRHTAVVRTILRPSFDGDIELVTLDLSSIDGLVETGFSSDTVPCAAARTRKYGVEVALAQHVLEDRWTGDVVFDGNRAVRRMVTCVRAGEAVVLTVVTRLATSLETTDPRALVSQPPEIYEALLAAHEAAHDHLRETAIEIGGDDDAQRFVDAGLFYLWNGIGADDEWSIPPMGPYGSGYNGHIFWDAETWMYPALLVTHPALARSCLAYRERTVDAAKERAQAEGRDGVRFPWEGGFTGAEMTPSWAEPRELQIHITADVAIALWWHYLNSRDDRWLRERGFPVMKCCAAYFADRVELGEDGRYHIRDVQCADEYAVHVDDDAYTNGAIVYCLRCAARAGEIVGEMPPGSWLEIADRIAIARAPDGRILEFEGYDGRTIKQADVALLTFPLEMTTPEEARQTLDYYPARTDPNGPAMSFSVYAIVACRLGRPDEALRYFKRSYQPNTQPPFAAVSETPDNNSFLFCTGIGGSIQAVVYGFAGIRLREWGFEIRPALPAEWSQMRLRNLFLSGLRTTIEIEGARVTVSRRVKGDEVTVRVERRQTDVSVEVAGDGTAFRVMRPDGSAVEPDGMSAQLSVAGDELIRIHVVSRSGATIPDFAISLPEE